LLPAVIQPQISTSPAADCAATLNIGQRFLCFWRLATYRVAPHTSAFGDQADMPFCTAYVR